MMAAYKTYRFLGLVLAIALLFNTLLPFFATYSMTAPPSGPASVFGEKVLICTGQGFKLVNWKDLQAGKTPVGPHKSYVCPLCYIANSALGNVLLPALVLYLACIAIGPKVFSRYVARFQYGVQFASCPRAPPACC